MLKYRIKDITIFILYNIILLTISFLLGRFYQMLIFVLFYSFIQNCFNYRFHAESIQSNPIKAVKMCKIITITVEMLYLAFCQDLDISIYSNLFLIFVITLINCLLEFSLKYAIINKNSLRNKETLISLCQSANLTPNATNRMIMKYIENKTYSEIADIECVDIETIKKSINRSRNKIFKNQD